MRFTRAIRDLIDALVRGTPVDGGRRKVLSPTTGSSIPRSLQNRGKRYPRSVRDTILDQTTASTARDLRDSFARTATLASPGTRRKWDRAVAAVEAATR